MDLCEQCWTHSATHIDEEAVFWCGRCADTRQPDSPYYPYLWEIAERRHFLSEVYPTLRYSTKIQDCRNPLWAKKLGVPYVPPGQRAVDQDDPPDLPAQQEEPAPSHDAESGGSWMLHMSQDGTIDIWVLGPDGKWQKKEESRLPSAQAALESWHKAQRCLETYERTKETLLGAQAAIEARKRADAIWNGLKIALGLEDAAPHMFAHDRWELNHAGRWERCTQEETT